MIEKELLDTCFPRMRGGDPLSSVRELIVAKFSPHARG